MAGVAMGSGMIHPNMATMLKFITLDANISVRGHPSPALSQNVERSHQITVGWGYINQVVLARSAGCTLNEEILARHISNLISCKGLLCDARIG